jgi:protoporphyrin/coproporphyrin ferrochelatase
VERDSLKKAVMLIGFGGPEAPEQIRPFLDRVLDGRSVPPARYAEVVHHYEVLGGRSPYNELTRRLAAGVRAALARRSVEIPVVIGLRNSPPYLADAIRDLAARGVRRVSGFILSAFRCAASRERYQEEIAAVCGALGAAAPAIIYPAPWHTRPQFIDASADRVRAAFARFDPPARDPVDLIFTAHSIPLAMADTSSYIEQLRETAGQVAEAVGIARWELAFQSRSGNPREPWLEPDVRDVIGTGARSKVVMPLGFLCDHVEVLYDLDIEAAALAHDAGVRMERAGTVGDHPAFVELIAEIALGSAFSPD